MNADELYETFRSDVVDTSRPYLWSDEEVYRYMADAHRMFVRLVGGIADISSDASRTKIVAGQAEGDIHPSVLRIMSARIPSIGRRLVVINETDLPKMVVTDYALEIALDSGDRPGEVTHMLIGQQRNKCRWVMVPTRDLDVQMSVYRLPLEIADAAGKEISEVDEQHHIHLLNWMKHLAYKKQDAETFNKSVSDSSRVDFEEYCAFVKKEWGRYKHKTRVVQYEGV